jgi:hypothetical protein
LSLLRECERSGPTSSDISGLGDNSRNVSARVLAEGSRDVGVDDVRLLREVNRATTLSKERVNSGAVTSYGATSID